MPRPDRSEERREAFRPVIARAFAELGYRRATTAELAKRCGVRENQLFRLWADKKAMFLEAIDFVHRAAVRYWEGLAEAPDGGATPAERMLSGETGRHAEAGLYRIVFTGLSEADDPEIRAALRRVFQQFHAYVCEQIGQHRGETDASAHVSDEDTAWAIIGMGLASDVMLELRAAPAAARKSMWDEAGRCLLRGE